MLLARLTLLALLLPTAALAQRATTQEALSRLEETLAMRLEDGGFSPQDVAPAIVVSTAPAFEETQAWYPAAALSTLMRVMGGSAGLRACEACMAPRLLVGEGRLERLSTHLDTADILRLDASSRGTAPPARVAVWLDETPQGVSLRIIDLRNSRIILAESFDPSLTEMARTRRTFSVTRELERRARGDSLTHTFIDITMYPGQHVSLDWTEQWGPDNANLAGVSLSLFDPVVGVGAAYYRVMPKALNIAVGAKVLMSVPTFVVNSVIQQPTQLLDPLLTCVLMARVPIATSNYGVILSASTNGRFGIGITLMNLSLLPVLP